MGKIIIEADNADELRKIIASLGMSDTATVVSPARTPQPAATPEVLTIDADEDSGPVNTAAPSVDTAGMPWDERIHSGKKSQNKDGTWRTLKGVDKTLLANVEAELRAGTGMPVQQQMQQPVVSPAGAVAMPTQQPMQQMPQTTMQPMQQPINMMQQPVQQQPANDFQGFMLSYGKGLQTINPATSAPFIDMLYGQMLANHFGLASVTDVQHKPELIPNLIAQIKVDGRWVD